MLSLVVAGYFILARDKQLPAHARSYDGVEGPKQWGDLKSDYATCKLGLRQSPIDIRDAKKASLLPIHFDYKPSALKLINSGHTMDTGPLSVETVPSRSLLICD